MLGGSVLIALLRFIISLIGVNIFYALMSEARYGRKKTIIYGACFYTAMLLLACIWYVIDWENCVKIVALAMYIGFAFFVVYMSKGPFYLSMYKLAFTYYLLAIFLIGGIEFAIIFFDGNVWADIGARIVLIILIALFINRYLRDSIKAFGAYVEKELDWFSVTLMIFSLVCGIGFILNPGRLDQSPYRFYQMAVTFFLIGTLQLLMFRLYLHIGKEQEYQKDNQLMQMNHRLLERQLEMMEEAVESNKRKRHNMKHHNAVIAEFARRGQTEELLQYLKECEEYEEGTDIDVEEDICENNAVNHILSAYARRAKKDQIQVMLDIELGKDLPIPVIDLVTILANAYENAIYGCMEVKKQEKERECLIHLMIKRKKNKLTIYCSNTCRVETELRKGEPKPEFTGGVGVSSIIKTAEKFDGEYDFKNDEGVFVFRLMINIL